MENEFYVFKEKNAKDFDLGFYGALRDTFTSMLCSICIVIIGTCTKKYCSNTRNTLFDGTTLVSLNCREMDNDRAFCRRYLHVLANRGNRVT